MRSAFVEYSMPVQTLAKDAIYKFPNQLAHLKLDATTTAKYLGPNFSAEGVGRASGASASNNQGDMQDSDALCTPAQAQTRTRSPCLW